MDSFNPRRRLLRRRLWRARCRPETKVDAEEMQEVREQKAFVRRLSCMLTVSQLDTLASIVQRRDDRPCLPVDAETAPGAALTDLVESCCQLWRPGWTDARAWTSVDHQRRQPVRRLPICHSPTVSCLNPYHYSVDVTSVTTAQLPLTERRIADRDSVETAVEPWCRIIYHQYRDHVATPGCSLPVHSHYIHVFSGLHHGDDGLCLSAVRSTSTRPLSQSLPPSTRYTAEQTLVKVGRGVTLSLERSSKTVWLYNRSDFAVFALSPTTQQVVKLLPCQSACVYDWFRRYDEEQDDYTKTDVERSSRQFDSILLSFVKGWSGRYKRQSILSCPCWLQVVLAKTPDGQWNTDSSEIC